MPVLSCVVTSVQEPWDLTQPMAWGVFGGCVCRDFTGKPPNPGCPLPATPSQTIPTARCAPRGRISASSSLARAAPAKPRPPRRSCSTTLSPALPASRSRPSRTGCCSPTPSSRYLPLNPGPESPGVIPFPDSVSRECCVGTAPGNPALVPSQSNPAQLAWPFAVHQQQLWHGWGAGKEEIWRGKSSGSLQTGTSWWAAQKGVRGFIFWCCGVL